MAKKKVWKKLRRRVVVNKSAMELTATGFSKKRATKWAKKAYRVKHRRKTRFTAAEIEHALKAGFFPAQLRKLEVVLKEHDGLITPFDYEYLGAINGKIGKQMSSNKDKLYKRLRMVRSRLPKHYYKVSTNNGLQTVEVYGGSGEVLSIKNMVEELKNVGAFRIKKANGTASSLLEYKNRKFYFDGEEVTEQYMIARLSSYQFEFVVTEEVQVQKEFEGVTLRLLVVRKRGYAPHIGNGELIISMKNEYENPFPIPRKSLSLHDAVPATDGASAELTAEENREIDYAKVVKFARIGKYHAPVDFKTGFIGEAIRIKDGEIYRLEKNPNNGLELPVFLPHYNKIIRTVNRICEGIPRLRFFGLELLITPDGYKITRMLNHPAYPVTIPFDEYISNYLNQRVAIKRRKFESSDVRKRRQKSYIEWKTEKRRLRKGKGKKMKFSKKIENLRINIGALKLMSQGYVDREAKKWAGDIYALKHGDTKYTSAEAKKALKMGYVPAQLKRMETAGVLYDGLISAKDYAYLCPINGGYSKWITDRITMNAIFKPYRDVMPKCYYQIYKRDGETKIIPLFDFSAGRTFDDLLNMVKEKGDLRVRVSDGTESKLLAYVNGQFYYGSRQISKENLIETLSAYHSTLVVTENVLPSKDFNGARLRLTVFNEQGDNPTIGDAVMRYYTKDTLDDLVLVDETEEDDTDDASEMETMEDDAKAGKEEEDSQYEKDEFRAYVDPATGRISNEVVLMNGTRAIRTENPSNGLPLAQEVPFWDQIVETIDSLCRFAPQLEYFGADIIIGEDGFKIMKMTNHPGYPSRIPFSRETSEYLKRKLVQKKALYANRFARVQRGAKKLKLFIRARYARAFFPKGLRPYLSIRWFQDLKKDFLTNRDTTLKQKIWATKHGFLSYRLPQYGITKENHLNYISDFEYKWLRHINNKYRVWMEDKITVKYICSEYNSCFPEYYYHISLKNGSNRIIPMMDCPKELGNSFDDIVALVHEKGALALKPDEGSHGDGFYKFSYEEGKYYLNHEEATLDDVKKILDDVNNQYLVTEYINMHEEIKRIYDGAVNTIRMIVFKKDGVNPVIGNAYMRFGSKRTGAVDNMGAGGMFAKIDIDTGRFYDAKIIEANEIKPCLHHPDTGVMIDGYLPNWEKVKEDVLNVARNIPQLEYFGFDLALTETGLKFPEINRFPDYPAIEKYTPETIDYLLYKLEQRKKRYGYDVSRGNTLVKLPKR